MKIMKLNGTIVNTKHDIETYDWVSGEVEYSLVYDANGELYGIDTYGIDEKVLDDIVENIYRYDFPNTLAEYLDI